MRIHRRKTAQPGFFDRPCGDINQPAAGAEVAGDHVQVLGWALLPGSRVARVEVTVGDEPPQRARLGMPRFDVANQTDHPSATIAGFEYMAPLAPHDGEVAISATAYSCDGRAVDLGPVTISVAHPPTTDESDEATLLQERAARYARPHLAPSNGKLRMVAFSHQLPYGGASLYLVEVLKRFVRKPEFECTVVTYQDGPLRKELESLGIEVHVTDPHPVMTVARYEASVAELAAWAAPKRFDVAFVNTLGSFHGADVARRLGLPVVWAVHESFELPLFWSVAYPGTLHPYARARAEQSFRDAAAVIFEAEATRRLFVDRADPDRLIAFTYGIELDAVRAASASYDRDEIRSALGIDPDARVVLCLGTIEARKSQAMLAEAFAAIADRHPDTVLALVGAIDAQWCADYLDALRAFVRRNGLSERIRVEDTAANPYPWHLASDLHVCASDVESLPRSILEAMAFRVPVVSTRVFGVSEVIEDGVSGYLCDMRDSAGLTTALDRALSAPDDELRRITAAAADVVYSRHDPAPYADRLWTLFARLARDPSADARRELFGDAPAPAMAR